jgi:hypothetical protein
MVIVRGCHPERLVILSEAKDLAARRVVILSEAKDLAARRDPDPTG